MLCWLLVLCPNPFVYEQFEGNYDYGILDLFEKTNFRTLCTGVQIAMLLLEDTKPDFN